MSKSTYFSLLDIVDVQFVSAYLALFLFYDENVDRINIKKARKKEL